jgi:tetratricopeptide (TPR) repeat protein
MSIKNYDKMLKYIDYGLDVNDATCLCMMAIYYHNHDNYDKMIEYHDRIIETGNYKHIHKLIPNLESKNDHENIKKYCLLGMGKYPNKSYYLIRLIKSLKKQGKYDEMKHYCNEGLHIQKVLYILSNYYLHIEGNYKMMKKYCMMAIDKKCSKSMYNMGLYYENIKKYDKMKHYYEMAIQFNCHKSMCNLGGYYQYVEKDYDKMKHYYDMAVELNCIKSMSNYSNYYKYVEINPEKMEYYNNKGLVKSRDNCMKYMSDCVKLLDNMNHHI